MSDWPIFFKWLDMRVYVDLFKKVAHKEINPSDTDGALCLLFPWIGKSELISLVGPVQFLKKRIKGVSHLVFATDKNSCLLYPSPISSLFVLSRPKVGKVRLLTLGDVCLLLANPAPLPPWFSWKLLTYRAAEKLCSLKPSPLSGFELERLCCALDKAREE